MSNFKREDRYAVIKYSQLTEKQLGFLKDCIYGEGIPTVESVVIESDWPEYEQVWKMIEDRAIGAPVEGGKTEYDEMAKATTNNKTVTMSRELAEVLLSGPPGDAYLNAKKELRALLAAPVVESQEPAAIVTSVISRKNKLFEIDILNTKSLTIGDKLYTSPPAPVAVVLPDLSVIREYHDDASIRLDSYADDADMRKSDSAHYRKRAAFHRDQVATLDKVKELNQ